MFQILPNKVQENVNELPVDHQFKVGDLIMVHTTSSMDKLYIASTGINWRSIGMIGHISGGRLHGFNCSERSIDPAYMAVNGWTKAPEEFHIKQGLHLLLLGHSDYLPTISGSHVLKAFEQRTGLVSGDPRTYSELLTGAEKANIRYTIQTAIDILDGGVFVSLSAPAGSISIENYNMGRTIFSPAPIETEEDEPEHRRFL